MNDAENIGVLLSAESEGPPVDTIAKDLYVLDGVIDIDARVGKVIDPM